MDVLSLTLPALVCRLLTLNTVLKCFLRPLFFEFTNEVSDEDLREYLLFIGHRLAYDSEEMMRLALWSGSLSGYWYNWLLL